MLTIHQALQPLTREPGQATERIVGLGRLTGAVIVFERTVVGTVALWAGGEGRFRSGQGGASVGDPLRHGGQEAGHVAIQRVRFQQPVMPG
jgi:hypothetical protein